jgi:hypothetical protein
MKAAGGVHLKSTKENFQLHMTKQEQEWRSKAITELPHLDPQLSIKLLNKRLEKQHR